LARPARSRRTREGYETDRGAAGLCLRQARIYTRAGGLSVLVLSFWLRGH